MSVPVVTSTTEVADVADVKPSPPPIAVVTVTANVVSDKEVTATGPTTVMLGVSVVKGSVVGSRLSTKSVVIVSTSVKVCVSKVLKSTGEETGPAAAKPGRGIGSMGENGTRLRA